MTKIIRKIIYLSLLLVLIVSVFVKANIIKEKNKTEKISINSEWIKYGKPVEIAKAQKKDFIIELNISGILNGDLIQAEVSPQIRYKLYVNQNFCLYSDALLCGTIQYVANRMNSISGLYIVVLKLNKKPNLPNGTILVASVVIQKDKNKLLIPNVALQKNEQDFFVYLVNSANRIQKVNVKIGKNNYEYTEVVSGLKEDDLLVTSATHDIKEDDLVRIFNNGDAL